MKFLLLLLFATSTAAFAQNYAQEIALHRENYKNNFVAQSNSPLQKEDLKHLNFFNPDSTYSIKAAVKILKNEKIFKMPTYDGTNKEFIRYAQVNFALNGQRLKLTLYRNIALMANPAYKNLLFLPFNDSSNGESTYGGGRYIDLDVNHIINKQIAIDFNKAYNPYCAYSDGYRCPIPPQENRLSIEILAGEKLFTGEKKHK
jgi:uncharacterized protein (DUF1684 family)